MSSSLTWRTKFIGVWCNASIRVLGTRGDSSILSSPTKRFAPVAQWKERDASNVEAAGPSPARSSKISPHNQRGPPGLRIHGSDVAGNMRVFQTRLESSNLSFRSNYCARRQAAKAPDCKSDIREFESHRALQFVTD